MNSNKDNKSKKNDFKLYANNSKTWIFEIKDNMWDILIKKSDIIKIMNPKESMSGTLNIIIFIIKWLQNYKKYNRNLSY